MEKRPAWDFKDEICQPFLWEGEERHGKRHGVLLIHGFTGSIAHMRPIAEALHGQGFTVMGINLPGHATDMDDMARFTWEDWLGAAKDAFLRLKAQCDFVSVAGLSLGGCLTLLIGEEMQPTAIAPISAPMGTQSPLWLATLVSPVVKTVWWKPRREGDMPLDSRYDCGYQGFRSRCARHLSRIIKLARQDLHAVTCPILVVQSRGDTTITPDSAEIIMKGVSSERKGVLWLEKEPHVCTISAESKQIAEAIAEHFRWAEEH
ncbi:MAG: alpha/beta hydrolase [Aristaeellaceae bacterium]